jgi:hypothetical protein
MVNASRTTLLVCMMFLAAACASGASQTLNPSPTLPPVQPATAESLPMKETVAPSNPMQEILSGPVVSGTGVTLELPRVTQGTSCLRLILAASGVLPPEGAAQDFRPPPPMIEAAFFQDGSVLVAKPMGGGGGGGRGPDGSIGLGQETVYKVETMLPSGDLLELTVELEMDPFFGFDSPLRFLVQAEPDPSTHCGLQGTDAP